MSPMPEPELTLSDLTTEVKDALDARLSGAVCYWGPNADKLLIVDYDTTTAWLLTITKADVIPVPDV